MNIRSKLIIGGCACLIAAPALAAPIVPLPASQSPSVQTVAWHGGGWHRGGWRGPGLGFATGALIGSALAAPYYYDTYPPAYAYVPEAGAGSAAYCEQRFRSYDPASGTYLGYDGLRHPCP